MEDRPHHRTLSEDVKAFRRLQRGLERRSGLLDRGVIEVVAAIVVMWPAPDATEPQRVARRLYAQGRSMRSIAQLVGADRLTVSAWTKGLPRTVGRGHRIPPELREEVIRLALAGATQYDVAEQTGVSQPVISRLLAEHRQAA